MLRGVSSYNSIGSYRRDLDIVRDVFGPGASTDNAAVRFDGTDGKKLQNSGVLIDDSNNVKVPSITANRLVRSNASQQLNEADLSDFVAGTANEISVTDDGDGSITLGGAGVDGSYTVLSGIRAGGAGALGIEYREITIFFSGGIAYGSSLGSWTAI